MAAAALAVACGEDPKPPPKVGREDAGVHVQRVSKHWTDTIEEEGFLQGDPLGVAQFHVTTTRDLRLGDGAAATLRVDRRERYTMTNGGAFTCTTKGEVPASAAYAWSRDEAEVHIATGAARLPRTCEPAGFPAADKVIAAEALTFVLRGDRLIGRSSARDHAVLLPAP